MLREVDVLRGRIVELEQMADTDPMTALANRRALDREMVRALATVERHDMPYVFALLDVDALKRINDGHGHLAGDTVLRRLAIGLRDSFRQTDIAARLGGDEFALILPRVSLDDAQARLARFMADFSGLRLCAVAGQRVCRADRNSTARYNGTSDQPGGCGAVSGQGGSAVRQIIAVPRGQILCQIIDDRLPRWDFKARNFIIGNVGQVLHQCAKAIAMR